MTETQTATEMRTDALEPSPENLRRKPRDGQQFKQLVASIEAVGILEPLLVSPNGGEKFLIVAGHRRWEAAKELGLDTVPVTVRMLTAQQITEAMLVENLQRSDLLPTEEAAGYMRLVDLGMTKKELAKRVGRSVAHVTERMRLFDLPAKVRQLVDNGTIPVGAVEHLLKLESDDMSALIEEAVGPRVDWRWDVDEYQQAVGQKLKQREQAEKIAKARELAAQSGYPVHEFEWSVPGNSKLAALSEGFGNLELDKKKHRTEPCHAIVLLTKAGKTVEVCSDPQRHTPKGGSGLKVPAGAKVGRALTDREKSERAAAKAKKEQAKARREEMAELLKGKLPSDAPVMALQAFVLDANQTQQKSVCAMLGLEVPKDQGFDAPERALTEYLDGPAKTTKAAVALAFLLSEESWRHGLRERVGEWLTAQGVENDFAKGST